eukprot:9409732-Heterocapsa_arctica.AAC.1
MGHRRIHHRVRQANGLLRGVALARRLRHPRPSPRRRSWAAGFGGPRNLDGAPRVARLHVPPPHPPRGAERQSVSADHA